MSDTHPSPRIVPAPRCPVRVVVRENRDPDTIIHDREGDHSERYFRDWITNTTWWALRNDKMVSLYPL